MESIATFDLVGALPAAIKLAIHKPKNARPIFFWYVNLI